MLTRTQAVPADPHTPATPALPPRAYRCDCGCPLFFRNSLCLQCDRPLGYDPDAGALYTLVPGPSDGLWRVAGAPEDGPLYRRCDNLANEAACNWVVRVDGTAGATDTPPPGACLCAACRLNRTIPDLSDPNNAILWGRIELAKRRLVSALITLGLPVASRIGEDPQRGLAFDFLHSLSTGIPVMTGHHDGIITVNVEEADDALREQFRTALHEPYRTLLGHLRHEVGHYYWYRLVLDTPWQERFRAVFGDERLDYAEALHAHYAQGPQPDWQTRCVSAYASSHPWEDWAETWAHYLHMVDAIGTASSFGLGDAQLAIEADPFLPDTLKEDENAESAAAAEATAVEDETLVDTRSFLDLINTWVRLTAVMNELSRSMGQHDFYPFVLSPAAVRKLFFVHRLVLATAAQAVAPSPE